MKYIFNVKTTLDPSADDTFDSFNVVAADFDRANEKANEELKAKGMEDETIHSITRGETVGLDR